MVDVCAVSDMFVEIHVSQCGEMLFFEHQFPLGAESELRMPDSRCPVRNPQFADCLDRDRPASGNLDRSPDAVTGINKYSEIGNVSAVKMESVIQ